MSENERTQQEAIEAAVETFRPLLLAQLASDYDHVLRDYEDLGLAPPSEDELDLIVERVTNFRFDASVLKVWEEGLYRFTWDYTGEQLMLHPNKEEVVVTGGINDEGLSEKGKT